MTHEIMLLNALGNVREQFIEEASEPYINLKSQHSKLFITQKFSVPAIIALFVIITCAAFITRNYYKSNDKASLQCQNIYIDSAPMEGISRKFLSEFKLRYDENNPMCLIDNQTILNLQIDDTGTKRMLAGLKQTEHNRIISDCIRKRIDELSDIHSIELTNIYFSETFIPVVDIQNQCTLPILYQCLINSSDELIGYIKYYEAQSSLCFDVILNASKSDMDFLHCLETDQEQNFILLSYNAYIFFLNEENEVYSSLTNKSFQNIYVAENSFHLLELQVGSVSYEQIITNKSKEN